MKMTFGDVISTICMAAFAAGLVHPSAFPGAGWIYLLILELGGK